MQLIILILIAALFWMILDISQDAEIEAEDHNVLSAHKSTQNPE